MHIKMILKGIVLDPVNHMPVILLKQEDEDLLLPIWIGIYEANAIALKLDNVDTPRPMTHDLLSNVFGSFGAKVTQVLISKLQDNTFFAEIHALYNNERVVIDSRPSDAIALAVRCEVPIFAEKEVLKFAQSIKLGDTGNQEELKKWFEGLDPEDFGKYKM